MKKTVLTIVLAASIAAAANAEILRVTMNDGTSQTFSVENVKEMTFEEDNPAAGYAGEYKGTNSVVVGGMFTYTADIAYRITGNADGTINLTVPTYQLTGTVMGDLTIGEHTISGIAFDEAKGAFYRVYDGDGLSVHMTAVKDGTTSMDKDYSFVPESSVLLQMTEGGLKVVDSFKIGAMPFPLVATFTEAE